MDIERRSYSVAEFCVSYGMSRATFYRLLQSGQGPAVYHIGKRTMISAAAADEWRRRMEQTNAGPAQRVTPYGRRKPDEAPASA